MPLSKVERLADILIDRGYVQPPRLLLCRAEFRERTELFVMLSLYLLGRSAAFFSCRILCNISTLEICHFFFPFLDVLVDMRNEFIKLPENIQELINVTCYYKAEGLPGACGSMDVVHVKWSNCPSGDSNHVKGKEGYPTLAFQCIPDFNRCILGVYGPQFGTFNDKQIMKTDTNVKKIYTGWFKDVWWRYYTADGIVRDERGMYLICDNGYLH